MEDRNFSNLIAECVGKQCTVETMDGSRRFGKVSDIGGNVVEFAFSKGAGLVEFNYPTVLYFEGDGDDGVDLRIVKRFFVDE